MAKVRIIGVALGSIIATIIPAHMRKSGRNDPARPISERGAAHLEAKTLANAAQAHPARFVDHIDPGDSRDVGQGAADDPTIALEPEKMRSCGRSSIPVMNARDESGLIRIREAHFLDLDMRLPGLKRTRPF